MLSVLTAYLVRYHPQLKTLGPDAPIVWRAEDSMVAAGISRADMLAWSLALNETASSPDQVKTKYNLKTRRTRAKGPSKKKQITTGEEQAQDAPEQEQLPEPKPKRRKNLATNLSATWFEWYTKVPPVWSCDDRQKKSEYRHVVAFMKLFLEDGFALDANAADFKDRVLETGRRAVSAVLVFLKARGVNSKGTGSVLRSLGPLHRSCKLD
ncbi:unnamed protein product [Phytophthora fragariaefolia]|uniref:Unnamed protein product n=1 Tax=Phytophthora fragariaefolia TaxID=1490495 RepID=A0A9W6WVH0_9STRA|nr:unnamed protein product [Phytophthora fragariaefolia]